MQPPCGPAWPVALSSHRWWVHVTYKLFRDLPVLCSAIPVTLRWDSAPHQWIVNRRWQCVMVSHGGGSLHFSRMLSITSLFAICISALVKVCSVLFPILWSGLFVFLLSWKSALLNTRVAKIFSHSLTSHSLPSLCTLKEQKFYVLITSSWSTYCWKRGVEISSCDCSWKPQKILIFFEFCHVFWICY